MFDVRLPSQKRKIAGARSSVALRCLHLQSERPFSALSPSPMACSEPHARPQSVCRSSCHHSHLERLGFKTSPHSRRHWCAGTWLTVACGHSLHVPCSARVQESRLPSSSLVLDFSHCLLRSLHHEWYGVAQSISSGGTSLSRWHSKRRSLSPPPFLPWQYLRWCRAWSGRHEPRAIVYGHSSSTTSPQQRVGALPRAGRVVQGRPSLYRANQYQLRARIVRRHQCARRT